MEAVIEGNRQLFFHLRFTPLSLAHSRQQAQQNRMGGAAVRARRQQSFVFLHVQLRQSVNRRVHHLRIAQRAAEHRTAQLHVRSWRDSDAIDAVTERTVRIDLAIRRVELAWFLFYPSNLPVWALCERPNGCSW